MIRRPNWGYEFIRAKRGVDEADRVAERRPVCLIYPSFCPDKLVTLRGRTVSVRLTHAHAHKLSPSLPLSLSHTRAPSLSLSHTHSTALSGRTVSAAWPSAWSRHCARALPATARALTYCVKSLRSSHMGLYPELRSSYTGLDGTDRVRSVAERLVEAPEDFPGARDREFFTVNLLVQIHYNIAMIRIFL